MSVVPTWLAATVGKRGDAGLINQFLVNHTSSFSWANGVIQDSQQTGTGVYIDTINQWLSQTTVTTSAQTGIGSVSLQISTFGGSPTLTLIPALTVSLYADASGIPTGSALATATVASTYVYSAPFWVSIPLMTTVTPSTVYHLVVSITGTAGHYYLWQQSNQLTGCATSPDGSTWTTQNFGLMYRIYDQTAGGNLNSMSQDNGNLLINYTYNSLNQITGYTQFTLAQDGTFLQTSGTITYTNGLPTGVS